MGIQGMELCAMAVVVLLFIAVLKQFGILEPMSMEGNAWPRALRRAPVRREGAAVALRGTGPRVCPGGPAPAALAAVPSDSRGLVQD